MSRAIIPAWARRRNRERQAEENDRAAARMGDLVGAVLVDVIWSNDTLRPYHPQCRAFIPEGRYALVEMGVDATDPRMQTETCGHCGRPLLEDPTT